LPFNVDQKSFRVGIATIIRFDMARIRLLAGLIIVALTLAGCASTAPAPVSSGGADLAGTRWLAEDIGGTGVIDDLQTTLEFESNTRALAFGGCNNAFGNVAISGDRIEFGAFGVTRKACAAAVMIQEDRFFGALRNARRFRLDTYSDLLFFIDRDDQEILRFSRMAPSATEPVED
jgi:heat shock protein HslJ